MSRTIDHRTRQIDSCVHRRSGSRCRTRPPTRPEPGTEAAPVPPPGSRCGPARTPVLSRKARSESSGNAGRWAPERAPRPHPPPGPAPPRRPTGPSAGRPAAPGPGLNPTCSPGSPGSGPPGPTIQLGLHRAVARAARRRRAGQAGSPPWRRGSARSTSMRHVAPPGAMSKVVRAWRSKVRARSISSRP